MEKRQMETLGLLSPVGELTLVAVGDALAALSFSYCEIRKSNHDVLKLAKEELNRYFAGNLFAFTVPLDVSAPPFTRAVYEALLGIPYGQTRSYGEIALEAGSPRACRAVGNAVKANPLPIFIPCHRVLASNGPGGYTPGMWIKKTLLRIEGVEL